MNDKPSNQGVKTANDQCHNTHQESIILNTVTESDIYDNYSFTSLINWKIEKTPETYSKKIEFNIDKPEIGLKKIDFNIITNNDEIDDMNDDKIVLIKICRRLYLVVNLVIVVYVHILLF